MEMRTELGRIDRATFGCGGYNEAMIGLTVALAGKSWGTTDFKGAWGVERTEHTKWTEDDRRRELADACLFLRDLLKKTRKQTVDQLAGTPVEATFEGNLLKSWRVLEEVLP